MHHVSHGPRLVYEGESSSSDEVVRVEPRRHRRNGSVVSSHHHRRTIYDDVMVPSPAANLAVPTTRPRRSASTSGMPQPQIIINADNRHSGSRHSSHSRSRSRSRSRERRRPRSRSRGRHYEDAEAYYVRGPSRSPSPFYHGDDRGYALQQRLDKLKRIEDQQEKDQAIKDAKERYEAQKLKDLIKKEQEDKQRKEDKKKAVEEWQREQDEKKAKEKKEKEEKEKYQKEGQRELLRKQGYSEEYIEAFLKGEKKKDKVEMQLAVNRPKHIKVRREYLLAETLDHYKIPWYYLDKDYIVIEEYVSLSFQEELFEHTRRVKDRKLLVAPSVTKETILKVKDKHGRRDKMYIVRKKSPVAERRIVIG